MLRLYIKQLRPSKNVSAYNERLKTKLCECKKSYITYPHITLELNLTDRSSGKDLRFIRTEISGWKPLEPTKNLIFMDRDQRTEYQPTLCPHLDPTRSLGRSKLTNTES